MRVEVGVQALQLCHPLVPFLSGCGHQQHVSTERCNNSPWQPYVTPGTYATVTTRDGDTSYCHLPEISHPSRKVSVLHECDLIVRVWHVCVQCFQHRYPNPIYGRCMYVSRQCVCLSDPSHSRAMIKWQCTSVGVHLPYKCALYCLCNHRRAMDSNHNPAQVASVTKEAHIHMIDALHQCFRGWCPGCRPACLPA